MNRRCPVLLACVAALALGGCDSAAETPTRPAPPSTVDTSTAAPSSAATASSVRPTRRGTPPVRPSGKLVVLDPGHNGGNGANPSAINRQVPAGRGVVKACNTTGTATSDGYPEHAFTFDVAQRVRKVLLARGFRVALTRQDDTGVGPCVNERATIGNRLNADAVVSIHADGSSSGGARGFHVAYSWPPLNDAQSGPSVALAGALRDGMARAGFPTSNYLGTDGLDRRDDLGGLNLSTRPSVLLECGNMRNPAEASLFASPAGRQRYATAVATGIAAYLR